MARKKPPVLEPMTYRVSSEAYPHVYRAGEGLFKPGAVFTWPERALVTDQPSLKLEAMTQRAYDKQVAHHGGAKVFAAWPESEFGPGAHDPEVKELEAAAIQAQEDAALAAQRAHEAAGNAAVARRNVRVNAGIAAVEADAQLEQASFQADDELEAAEAESKANVEEIKGKPKPKSKPKGKGRRAPRVSDSE